MSDRPVGFGKVVGIVFGDAFPDPPGAVFGEDLGQQEGLLGNRPEGSFEPEPKRHLEKPEFDAGDR